MFAYHCVRQTDWDTYDYISTIYFLFVWPWNFRFLITHRFEANKIDEPIFGKVTTKNPCTKIHEPLQVLLHLQKTLLIRFCVPYHWDIYFQCLVLIQLFGHILWIPSRNKNVNGHFLCARYLSYFQGLPYILKSIKRILHHYFFERY